MSNGPFGSMSTGPSDVKRQNQSNAKRDLTWHSGWLLRGKVRPRGLPRFPTKILNT